MNNKAQEKHTPGPWIANNWRVVSANDQYTVCDIEERLTIETSNANARLIAAAPELLEACKAVLANAEDAESTCDDDGKEYSDIAKLRAAIAKAEGRTP